MKNLLDIRFTFTLFYFDITNWLEIKISNIETIKYTVQFFSLWIDKQYIEIELLKIQYRSLFVVKRTKGKFSEIGCFWLTIYDKAVE